MHLDFKRQIMCGLLWSTAPLQTRCLYRRQPRNGSSGRRCYTPQHLYKGGSVYKWALSREARSLNWPVEAVINIVSALWSLDITSVCSGDNMILHKYSTSFHRNSIKPWSIFKTYDFPVDMKMNLWTTWMYSWPKWGHLFRQLPWWTQTPSARSSQKIASAFVIAQHLPLLPRKFRETPLRGLDPKREHVVCSRLIPVSHFAPAQGQALASVK